MVPLAYAIAFGYDGALRSLHRSAHVGLQLRTLHLAVAVNGINLAVIIEQHAEVIDITLHVVVCPRTAYILCRVALQTLTVDVGKNIEQVIVEYKHNTDESKSWKIDLITDMGYSFTYISPYLVVELTDAHPDNGDAYEEGAAFEDDFTDKIMGLFKENDYPEDGDFGERYGKIYVTLVSVAIGDTENRHNNILNSVSFTYQTKLHGQKHSATDDDND